jgi:transposase-like protein
MKNGGLVMKMPEISLMEWQNRFGTEEACVESLVKVRWPDGFICPECAEKEHSFITSRKIYQCCHCNHQTSVTSGTIFHSTNLPLFKWFWAIYLTASDKGGISALRLSKHLGVSWITAQRMLRKIRRVMAHRDSIYRLENLIECDDAFIGGKRPGKRGRGAAGKKPVLVAVERRGKHAGFMAAETVEEITKNSVRDFLRRHVHPGQEVRTDALPALNAIAEDHIHQKQVTPPEKASEWLPLVHIVIGNLKTFLNGTFHGVTEKYLHEYVDEFCYRFNRRFWEYELPMRLLNACLAHVPFQTENC